MARLHLAIGHSSPVSSCACSPDGRRLVSGGRDGAVKIWDAETGECVLSIKAHSGGVQSCAYSPDGRRLVSVGADGAVTVWDADTGAAISRCLLLGHGEHAVLDGMNALVEATPGAWRWLRYQLLDEVGRIVDVVPAETFGELPVPKRMVTPAARTH